MIEIKTKDNEQDYRYVRIEVFMKEQGFQNEFDEIDATAVHITVYVDGTLAGCARCFPKEEEAAWVFGRIAVLPQFRHQGLGGVLLSEMESIVHSKKGRRCMHNAVPVRFMKAMAIPYAGRSIWMSMFLMYRWRSCCE